MNHMILVKWNEQVTDKAAILKPVQELFAPSLTIDGIQGVDVIPCCVDRANRYDCMILLHMKPEALTGWDASEIHHIWKETYGSLIEKKAIFDWE